MKLKKRLLSIILTISVVFCSFGFLTCKADELTPSNKCGDNITWEYNKATQTLTLNGYGKMYDYNCSNLQPWANYDFVNLILHKGITDIGINSFSYCKNLIYISLPNTLKTIGNYAFAFCEKIDDITLPNSVTKINISAFQSCKNLKQINLPDGITEIAYYTFADCESLTNIQIPEKVTELNLSSFYGCIAISQLNIPNNIKSILGFQCCNLINLTDIIVDENNTEYSSLNGALYNKSGSKLIWLPTGKRGTYLLPKAVTSISDCAFDWENRINSITAEEDSASYSSYDGVLFNKDFTELIYCPANKSGELLIPAATTSIQSNALISCSCINSVKVDSDNTVYSEIDGLLYNKNKTELVLCPPGRAGKLIIPDGTEEIGFYNFFMTCNVQEAFFPKSVTRIDAFATFEELPFILYCYKDSYTFKFCGERFYPYQLISSVKGDLNGDETLSANDLVTIKMLLISEKPFLSIADLNNDNTVDIRDLICLKKMCAE